jgi:hypothetical protein
MFSWLGKVFKWIKTNAKWILLGLVSLFLIVVCFSWYKKNRQIRKLKNEVLLLQAKVKLERLATKYDALLSELGETRKKNAHLELDIQSVENSLKKKLEPDMTAGEIIAAFKKVGLSG